MKKPETVDSLTKFGRIRLSEHFFMRDFLFSDIAAIHGLSNIPDDPDLAVEAGTRLCEDLLEPLQRVFGRIVIRSAYRSCEVNDFGSKNKYNCAANERNYAAHIWDRRDANGHMGATACIVIPEFVDAFPNEGAWTKLAWWIHDNLPYSSLYFFPINFAFNITWHEKPVRRIDSYTRWITDAGESKTGTLTKPGFDNHDGDHRTEWEDLSKVFDLSKAHRDTPQ